VPTPTHSQTRASKTPKRAVALYVRVSTDRQELEGYSLDEQLVTCGAFCDRSGFVVAETYVETETASRPGRKVFQQMIRDLQESGIKTIVTTYTDRFTRNRKDDIYVTEDLGIDVYFANEGRMIGPSSSSSDRLMHQIQVTFAENYSRRLKERVTSGMRYKASSGDFPGRAAIGYLNVLIGNRKAIVPDPERAPLILALFKAYAAGGQSLASLTDMAAQMGLRTRKTRKMTGGRLLDKCAIHRVLTNPIYRGEIDWGGVKKAGNHEPLVSLELWDRAQDRLGLGHNGRSGPSRVRFFVYSGMMSCGHCGCSITSERRKERYTYYRCTGMRDPNCPGKKLIREEEIHAVYGELFGRLAATPQAQEYIREAIHQYMDGERREVETRLAIIGKEASRLREQRRSLGLKVVDGIIPEDLFTSLLAEVDRNLAATERQARELKAAERGTAEDAVRLFTLAQNAGIRFKAADDATKRELVKTLQLNCVLKDRTLTIQLQEPFQLLLEVNQETSTSEFGGPTETAIVRWSQVARAFAKAAA
jgi:site-specific DNA recombinase